MDAVDYIIVGAGSAGCVLADRLSANGRYRVLLLEAGGRDLHPHIRVPIGYGMAFHDPKVNWRFEASPDPGLNNRRVYWPRGKVLGGSSAINAMVYCRGLPADFDDWRDAGNPGWDAAAVSRVFDRMERRICPDGRATGSGPVWVSDLSAQYHPLGRHYLEATTATGFSKGDTVSAEGVGPYATTIRAGWRHSAADAFLRPALRRKNLRVLTNAEVLGLLFEGRRVVGVRYRQRGASRTAHCTREVLLSAGSVKTPQILQLSGIGPGKLLSGLGIEVREDAPAVGGGLQDHLGMTYAFRSSEPTLNQVLGRLSGQVASALNYLFRRRGPFSLSVNQMGGLVRSRPGLGRADIQLYFNPLSYSSVERNRRPLLKPDRWPGFIIGFNPCRPTSRGRIDIESPDPSAAPRIEPNSLSTESDVADMIAGAGVVTRLLETDAMRRLVTGAAGFSPLGRSDDDILADIRDRAATVFHPCGTCRMAPRSEGGVVDPALRVWGVGGIRVVDASIFPNITSANTNAPAMMVAMKAADLILEA